MRKFGVKICFCICFCLVLNVIIPYCVDPYNVFHYEYIRDNGVEPNKNYIKMKYILNNPSKYDSFIFGSSRVGVIHVENMRDCRCYNMTYSVGLPIEHLNNIKTFISQGIIPKCIYIGVDNFAYTFDAEEHLTDPMRMPYEYITENRDLFYKVYLDPVITFKSLKTISTYKPTLDIDNFYENGWWGDYDAKGADGWTNDMQPLVGQTDNIDSRMEQALQTISEIKKTCDDYNIEVIFFTNPMHHVTHEAVVEYDYYLFLRKLSEITDFYNFSGINDITINNDNFLDTSHYNAYVGDMILDVIYNKNESNLVNQGFGMYVTKNNVDILIDILEEADAGYRASVQGMQ